MQTTRREWELTDWQALPSSQGPASGPPPAGGDSWLPATVPGSVLATLVGNGVYPDPYFGQNSTQIPDASEPGGVALYTYWFRTAVHAPPELGPDDRVFLEFRGINYSADVYLDGEKLNQAPLQGMFQRHAFEVTGRLTPGPGPHELAVRVTPPDPPGIPGGNGGHQGKPNIAESVTMRYGIGWDWVIPMPDRSTGLWDRVFVRASGPVQLRDPHVVTTVLDPAGQLMDDALVDVSATLVNASDAPREVTLVARLDDDGTPAVQETVSLGAGESREVRLPRITVQHPRLWWPNGMGDPALYTLALEAYVPGELSDARDLRIGIRQVTTGQVTLTAPPNEGATSRFFLVNGERVFVRGGNWIGTDAMLRLDARRYADEVRLHRDGGMNLIRVWGGGIAERPEFYAACDENGMLVMQDFWISGEYPNGTPDPFSPAWTETFLACARDTILLLRNHPSLLFWSGGNEETPPDDVARVLSGWIEGDPGDPRVLDGTRPYVTRSTNIPGNISNQYRDGPYGIQNLAWFFDGNTSQAFNPELGSVGTPEAESIRAMMDAADAEAFPACGASPPGATWQHHTYISYSNSGDGVLDQVCTYGTPRTLDEFAQRAQLANYAQYRAMFEGFTAGMWTSYAGFMLWKTQNPWPGLRGSLYDWYLDVNGGLYGVRAATRPVNALLNASSGAVLAANTSRQAVPAATVTATAYALDGTAFPPQTGTVSPLQPGDVQQAFVLDKPAVDGAYFVQLRLDAGDAVLSESTYWLTAADDFTSLDGMPRAALSARAAGTVRDGRALVRVELANAEAGAPLAFFVRLQVRTADGSARVLPVFYDDNYVSVVPGKCREVVLEFDAGALADGVPQLWLEGWNVDRARVDVEWSQAISLPPLAAAATTT
jgi:mannosylglycoprotein endo-beta-mannosidase